MSVLDSEQVLDCVHNLESHPSQTSRHFLLFAYSPIAADIALPFAETVGFRPSPKRLEAASFTSGKEIRVNAFWHRDAVNKVSHERGAARWLALADQPVNLVPASRSSERIV